MTEFTRTCEWCEQQFITEWETKLYCSRQHKEQSREHRKRVREGRTRTVFTRICKGCASNYTTTSSLRLYCSDDCRLWQRQQRKRDRHDNWANQRKGALKARVYLQSNGKCGICAEHIDSTRTYPDQLSLSIDHIIPRSQGGTHKLDNLQAAHLVCNSKRGARPLA